MRSGAGADTTVLEGTGGGNAGIKGTGSGSGVGGVTESTLWESEAKLTAAHGLQRLVQLAKDQHVVDPSKSVQAYYSEHLAKLIKEAEVAFDALKLK